MTTRTKVIVAIVGVLIGINLILGAVDRVVGGPRGGPVSSSFNSSAKGLAAYADLLRRDGHEVTQLRKSLSSSTLDPRSTIVVLDADLSAKDVSALQSFVQRGGRLVCGGLISPWLRSLVPDPPSLAPIPIDAATPITPVPEVEGVNLVRSNEPAAYTRTRSALPVLGTSALSLLAVEDVGLGRIEFLATASPLHDDLLGTDDNAALGLGIAGDPSHAVVFAEAAHGFGNEGWRAIPAAARWTLLSLLLATLLWIGSRIRRLGPPTPDERPLAPARRMYVASLAQTLSKTKGSRASLGALSSAARDRLVRLAALPSDADDHALREAAIRFGLEEDEALAVGRLPTDDHAVVAVGRAYAKLSRRS